MQSKTKIIMLHSATKWRLPSIAERVAYTLNKKGVSTQVWACKDKRTTKEFDHNYKCGAIKSDVVIVCGSAHITGAIRYHVQGSLFGTSGVRPHVSFLLNYDDDLHDKLMQVHGVKRCHDPIDYLELSVRVFGTPNHHTITIVSEQDEIWASGRILDSVLGVL